ncbi:ABC transporter substrate-binding protein [Streptomyces reniochalinae]|uniref:Sugar ABC transporter substrate-binding protein n=1 Tax=Streptomyces reniochalinae TaxID=2250578 RepID=A0A367EHE3_9ACTN|nr:sugar ABC transporter substrate-binding protein [Streptomyces reniochalinae]RCG17484.1 sugar ABC transporter substrate-binding protein [Streptomyces reniochalinae]
MRRFRTAAAAALTTALTAALASGCGGGTTTDGAGSNDKPKELTYWATNQASSLQKDKKILKPELAKFEKQTGIKVKLEVIPWSSLLDRILAAASSGQGPDVLNIGNTWSSSLQKSDALLPFDGKNMAKIGGKGRFSPSALAATGAEGKPPAAVPLYSLTYALYYNKQMFRQAGIDEPPKTWKELVAAGEKLTDDGHYGLALEAGDPVENAHHAFVFAKQHGADFFDASGKPTFDKPGNVKAVKQYVDFLAEDRISAKGNAEYAARQSVRDFAKGKAGMLLWQAAGSQLLGNGMKPADYGVAPVPVQSVSDTGDRGTTSMVAGINLAVFKNTDNIDGALKFVKFMTSDAEQHKLNTTYGSLSPVRAAQKAAPRDKDEKVMRSVLADSAAPLPQVPDESKFETLVGTAMKELFAQAAAGREVTTDSVRERLAKAQQQMRK